jgi:quinolinate synthase
MQTATISFDRFNSLADNDAGERIRAAKAKLGKDVVLLCHHYQRADVYAHADITGDSLKLSRLASQAEAKHIVFCGVHFMAEVADILSRPEQISILPDLAAGCSMADMASLAKVERAWRELAAVLDPDEKVTPVTYINSAADLKAFCGAHGGIVCTSSQRAEDPRMVLRPAREGAVLPRPAPRPLVRLQDGHPARRDGDLESRPGTGRPHARTDRQGEDHPLARLLFGAPDVPAARHHQVPEPASRWPRHLAPGMQLRGLQAVRPHRQHRNHPADGQGRAAEHALAGRHRAESRRAPGAGSQARRQDRAVHGLTICMCSTMQRIDPQHLAWTLENLVEGKVVNQISVPEHEAKLAKISLERMLAVS